MEPDSHPITIPDDFVAYPPRAFCIPSFYEEDVESVIIPQGMIRDRIKGLAREIFDLYASPSKDPEPLVLVCVLKSSYKFFCALQQEIEDLSVESCRSSNKAPSLSNGLPNGTGQKIADQRSNRSLPVLCEFIRVKSYINTEKVLGNDVQIQGVLDPQEAFADKNVLIVEDIIDTGRTMEALVRNLRQYNPKSTRVVSMLWKRVLHTGLSSFAPDFFGFEIPDRFVIGFGMDYNERYRDLNHLCIINPIGIQKYAVTKY